MCNKGAMPEATIPSGPQLHDRADAEKSAHLKSKAADGQDLKDLDADAGRRFMQGLGTQELDFWRGLAKQIVIANSDGKHCDEINSNFDLAFVRGVKPRDQIEAAQGMQMAIVHRLAIACARRLSNGAPLHELEIYERMFTRLTRTYLAQVEGLKFYRSSNGPGVTVQNVSVRDGGQAAIIGKITPDA